MGLLTEILAYLIAIIIMLGIMVVPNMYFNNQDIVTEAYESHSYSTLPNGHVEYTVYYDGGQEFKVYSWAGHRLFDSILYQDLDGDNSIDRIRYNAQEWKCNKLEKILIRKYDYENNKEEFDEADAKLQGLREKYQ